LQEAELVVYTKYAALYSEAMSRLSEFKRNEAFARFLEEALSKVAIGSYSEHTAL
jgi:hypothetical protein